MVVINTTEDFIRAMDENPSWLEAARSRVLTRELMEFPEKFAEYAEASDREFQAIRERFTFLNSRQDLFDLRMDRLDRDMSIMRNWDIRKTVRELCAIVAYDFGCEKVKTLSPGDIIAITRSADTQGIPANDLRGFHGSDIMMETVRCDTGETCYIVVAVSYAPSTGVLRAAPFATRASCGASRGRTPSRSSPASARMTKRTKTSPPTASRGINWTKNSWAGSASLRVNKSLLTRWGKAKMRMNRARIV